MTPDGALEGFYIETVEGLFFAVKGVEHPADRVIAVLRYAPDPSGERKRGERTYRRLYSFGEQERYIRSNAPAHLCQDPVFGTTLQAVAVSSIRRLYDPRQGLRELESEHARQAAACDALSFARLLRTEAGVGEAAIGITGSLLIGLATERSDIDMVVYGEEGSRKVHRALGRLLDGASGDVRRLDRLQLADLYSSRLPDTRMEFEDFAAMETRKVNQGTYRGRVYFVRFVDRAAAYGQVVYSPAGRVKIAARVSDGSEAIFTPCRYRLSDVRFLEGPALPDLCEIVSFRGRFCEQARAGEHVVAAGTAERLTGSGGSSRHRLLLGNSPQDMMVALGRRRDHAVL